MTEFTIHPIEPQHITLFLELYARAVSSAPDELRSAGYLSAIVSMHSKYSFGAWQGGELAGVAIGAAMGKIGAVLYCCVASQYQRQGIATALLETVTANVLSHAEVCIVQLPITAQWELGWLISCGFQCVEPQFIIRKPVSEVVNDSESSGSASGTQWQDVLNMEHFGAAMERAALGHFLRLGSRDACTGMIFVETASRRQAASQTAAVSFGSVRRSLGNDTMMAALRSAESIARNAKKRWLIAALNGIYHRELESVLKAGWTIAKTCHRMVHKKSLPRYRQLQALPQVDLSHWSL